MNFIIKKYIKILLFLIIFYNYKIIKAMENQSINNYKSCLKKNNKLKKRVTINTDYNAVYIINNDEDNDILDNTFSYTNFNYDNMDLIVFDKLEYKKIYKKFYYDDMDLIVFDNNRLEYKKIYKNKSLNSNIDKIERINILDFDINKQDFIENNILLNDDNLSYDSVIN